ncbi:uncharacterized protein LOC141849534 isoform X2 [Brevipalpus obovatus]|uniref:uncharacterized protein LOC141849534 isoform X2 n=1 Tax=Brevipalpus obovatus TaxID=246614 RepID=UPI003D9F151B
MENIDPNSDHIGPAKINNNENDSQSSRFSLTNYSPDNREYDDMDDDSNRNFEILLLPDRSASVCNNYTNTRLSPTSKSPPLLTNMVVNPSSGTIVSENYDPKQYPRRISLAENLFDSSSPSRTAIIGIPEFVETSIVLRKDKNNELGISIAGGSDTYLESIVVVEVHPFGAAYKDGRIRKGDLVLAVNDISFREVPWKDAVRVLKEAPSPLKLILLRENPQTLFTTSQKPSKFFTVELRKTSIKDKLGLSFMQRTNGRGVFVTYVQPGSIAARQGRKIMQGDQICEVNGQNVRELNQKDIATTINNLDGEIVLLLGRHPPLTNSIQEWCRKKAKIHWRTRTSTWSAYGGNKDKVQNQRPSLPAAKDQPYFSAKYSPDRENTSFTNLLTSLLPNATGGGGTPCGITGITGMTGMNNENEDANMFSRSSSVRSRVRLSVVIENNKVQDSMDNDDGDQGSTGDGDNRHLPSIQVTEF